MGKFTPGRPNTRIIKATYDFAVDGGGVGNKNLSVSIPDNAIITGGYIDVETDLASAGSATVGVGLAGAYTAFKNAAAFTDYTANGSGLILTNVAPPQTGVKTQADILVGIVIGTAALTGGKMHIYVTYIAGA